MQPEKMYYGRMQYFEMHAPCHSSGVLNGVLWFRPGLVVSQLSVKGGIQGIKFIIEKPNYKKTQTEKYIF